MKMKKLILVLAKAWRYPNLEDVDVMDPESMKSVPRDGKTIGEIMIRGKCL